MLRWPQGYGGIAVDTMSASSNWGRCGHYDLSGNWVQQYSGKLIDPAYQRDELAWEAAAYQHVHNYSKTATMQVNVSYEFGYSEPVNLQLMTTTDLLFDERGFTNYGSPPNVPPPVQWEQIMGVLQFVQRKGVCYMTNGEESSLTADIPQSARLWVIANYLLVKNNCTYMYMTGFTEGGGQDYGSLITFPEYSIPIGHATSAMKKTQGVWARSYSGGLTLVNPYYATATVSLPAGSYIDVNGNSVGPTLTMAGQTGEVLLNAQ